MTLDRVLITGGAGLIGSHIADELLRAGASEIVVFDDLTRGRLDNLAAAMERGRITVVEGDVRDPAQVRRVIGSGSSSSHALFT